MSNPRTVRIKTPLNHAAYVSGLLRESGLTRRHFVTLMLDALCAPRTPHPLAPHLGVKPTVDAHLALGWYLRNNPERITEDIQFEMCSQAARWNRSIPRQFPTLDEQLMRGFKIANKLNGVSTRRAVNTEHAGAAIPLEDMDRMMRVASGTTNYGTAAPARDVFPVSMSGIDRAHASRHQGSMEISYRLDGDRKVHNPKDAQPRRKLLGSPREGHGYFEAALYAPIRAQLETLCMKATNDPFNRFCTYLWLWIHAPRQLVLPVLAAKLAAFAEHATNHPEPRHWHKIKLLNAASDPLQDPHDIWNPHRDCTPFEFFWNQR